MLFGFIMTLSNLAKASEPKTPSKPNIILIMADDIGAEAFGCYGGQSYETPRINSLAEEGIRFENAFAMPLCSPSRVCILSGRYPFRSGVTTNKGGGTEKFLLEFRHDPWGIGEQPEITFAHLLKRAGYKTAVAGKWGLAQFEYNPDHILECGFDNYCAWARVYRNQLLDKYWVPSYIQDGKLHKDVEGVFGPDLYSDYLIDFIKKNKDGPFLVYYPMTLVHFMLEDPTKNPILRGEGSVERQKEYLAVDSVPLRERLSSSFFKGKGFSVRNRLIYKVNVEAMDKIVGKFIDAVDQLGIGDNTIIIFTGDNGSVRGLGGKVAGRYIDGAKGKLTDGGTRVPFVMRWPAVIKSPRVIDDLIDFSDVAPTLAKLAGETMPDDRVIDGISLTPQLYGEKGTPRQWVFAQNKSDIPYVPHFSLLFSRNLMAVRKSVIDRNLRQGCSEVEAAGVVVMLAR
jgi:arylsulfatase A